MTEKVSAALVGFDNPHRKGWLQTLQNIEGIGRLVACAPEGFPAGTAEEVDGVYTSVAEMLEKEELGLGLVCMRNDLAPTIGGLLLEADIPTLIEKPVARTAAEIEALNQISIRRNVPWATGYMNRCLPVAREFKKLVEGGALGRIVSIEGRMVTSSVQQRDPGHWLFDKERAGGGILHWLAIHTIDLIRYISGLEFTGVAGMVATLSDAEIDVEDMAAVSFTMSNGALGNLHAGYVLRQRYGDIYLSMRGSLGEVVWQMWDFDGRGNCLKVHSEAPGWEGEGYREISVSSRDAPGYGGILGIQFVSDFIDSAAAKKPFITNGEDALCAMRFVEAAYAASESGRMVNVERSKTR